MYSKAKISGHPIHPALIAFPVALYVVTAVALIVFESGSGDAFWFRVATYASTAGVVMALIAAVPGLIDLLQLPIASDARRTGVIHAVLNVSTVALFIVASAMLWRQWNDYPALSLDGLGPMILSLIGVALTCAAGALGWKLVQTYHVGIDDERVPITTSPYSSTKPYPTTKTPYPHAR